MATVREEVIVDLKVNAKGVENLGTGLQATAESSKNLNASIGTVTASIGALVATTVKMSFAFRIFNKLVFKNNVLFNFAQKGTKKFIEGQDKLIQKLTGKTIPSFEKLGKTVLKFTLGIVGAIAAFKVWIISMETTEQGSDTLATALITLDIITTRMAKNLGGAGEEVEGFFANFLRDMKESLPISTKVADELDRIIKLAREINTINKASLELEIIRVKATADRTKLIAEIRTGLFDETISLKDRIDLTEQLGRELADQATERIAELAAQQAALEARQEFLTKGSIERRRLELEIQRLISEQNIARDRGDDIIARSIISAKALLDAVEDVVEAMAPLMEPSELTFFGDETEQFVNQGKSLLDVFNAIQAEFKQDIIDGFAAIEEVGEEHIEVLDGQQERAARARIAWEKVGLEGKLLLAGQFLGAMSEIAQENFEVQKAFAIGETIVNTAAGIVRVWRDPGYPLAIPLTALVALNGIAAIASINAAQPGQSGTVLNPVRTIDITRPSVTIESAQNTFFQQNQAQIASRVVLVTEDLNTVQNRVQVTEDRASIG